MTSYTYVSRYAHQIQTKHQHQKNYNNEHFSAITIFFFSLPHFAIPNGTIYRPPAASFFLLLWMLIAFLRPQEIRFRQKDPGSLRWWIISFFVYCVLSTFYGFLILGEMDKLTLHLTTGNLDYLRVAGERLLQVMLMLVTFDVVRNSQHSTHTLIRWWLQGATCAVLLHTLTYIIIDDTIMQRAGTFTEGNLAGLYYLISVFLALEYRRTATTRNQKLFLPITLLGVVLSRSTAALMLIIFLLPIYFIFSAPNRKRRAWRILLVSSTVPSFILLMIYVGLDFGIWEKLFEDEVTANSFSRIDRLESISIAIHLFTNSPILGNGLQTYGFLSNDLIDGSLLSVYDESFRRIPNNIYAELAAELGIIGLLIFSGYLLSLIRQVTLRKEESRAHWLLGIFSILLYWNAFPTYSVIFIWVYFGLVAKHIHSINPHSNHYKSPPLTHSV